MTNERAKFLLSAYRHDGSDAQDPVFREALEQATRDPDLMKWLSDQRSFDAVVVEKLRSIQPPASLKTAILSGNYTGARKSFFPLRQLLAIAAVVALGGVLLVTMLPLRSHDMLSQYQNAVLAVLSEGPTPKLDMVTSDLSRSQEYLAERAVPRAVSMPASLRKLQIVGCKAIDWNGMVLSLTCFSLPGGELLHLFVADARSIGEIPRGLRVMNGWNVEMRREDGLLLILISKAPISELSQYI